MTAAKNEQNPVRISKKKGGMLKIGFGRGRFDWVLGADEAVSMAKAILAFVETDTQKHKGQA